MGLIKWVKVALDKTKFNADLQQANQEVSFIQKAGNDLKENIHIIAIQARQVSNMILRNFQDNAAVGVLLSAQNVLLTGLSIRRVAMESAAAFGVGHVVQGSLLASIAGQMSFSLIASQYAQLQAQRLQEHTNNINRMRDMYS